MDNKTNYLLKNVPSDLWIKFKKKALDEDVNNYGEILIADCFRSEKKHEGIFRQPGGGASLKSMERELEVQKINILKKLLLTLPNDILKKYYESYKGK